MNNTASNLKGKQINMKIQRNQASEPQVNKIDEKNLEKGAPVNKKVQDQIWQKTKPAVLRRNLGQCLKQFSVICRAEKFRNSPPFLQDGNSQLIFDTYNNYNNYLDMDQSTTTAYSQNKTIDQSLNQSHLCQEMKKAISASQFTGCNVIKQMQSVSSRAPTLAEKVKTIASKRDERHFNIKNTGKSIQSLRRMISEFYKRIDSYDFRPLPTNVKNIKSSTKICIQLVELILKQWVRFQKQNVDNEEMLMSLSFNGLRLQIFNISFGLQVIFSQLTDFVLKDLKLDIKMKKFQRCFQLIQAMVTKRIVQFSDSDDLELEISVLENSNLEQMELTNENEKKKLVQKQLQDLWACISAFIGKLAYRCQKSQLNQHSQLLNTAEKCTKAVKTLIRSWKDLFQDPKNSEFFSWHNFDQFFTIFSIQRKVFKWFTIFKKSNDQEEIEIMKLHMECFWCWLDLTNQTLIEKLKIILGLHKRQNLKTNQVQSYVNERTKTLYSGNNLRKNQDFYTKQSNPTYHNQSRRKNNESFRTKSVSRGSMYQFQEQKILLANTRKNQSIMEQYYLKGQFQRLEKEYQSKEEAAVEKKRNTVNKRTNTQEDKEFLNPKNFKLGAIEHNEFLVLKFNKITKENNQKQSNVKS